jgi:hypothetical protein
MGRLPVGIGFMFLLLVSVGPAYIAHVSDIVGQANWGI